LGPHHVRDVFQPRFNVSARAGKGIARLYADRLANLLLRNLVCAVDFESANARLGQQNASGKE
jgi:hypothetical protein